jgi:N-carbamoylputrescine amidase
MSSFKIAFAQWPEGLEPGDENWQTISQLVASDKPDILVTNEMPFGPWLAEANEFSHDRAQASVALHERGVDALRALAVPIVISSRPVDAGDRLANEAFVLEGSEYRFLHQKHYFPNEQGFFEAAWFETSTPGFQVIDVKGIRIAALLCTELMFNEHARHYGRAGADLIVVPRASGDDYRYWEVAAAMAALVSGAYVITANRTGVAELGQVFGGRGMLFTPQADELSSVELRNDTALLRTFEINLDEARQAKADYPCYVSELLG